MSRFWMPASFENSGLFASTLSPLAPSTGGSPTVLSKGAAYFTGNYDGVSGTYTYANNASWVFPDSDWYVVLELDIERENNGTRHVLAAGTSGSNNHVAIYQAGNVFGATVRATATNTLTSVTAITSGQQGILYLERTGTTLNLKWCAKNGTATTIATTAFGSTGTITPNSVPRIGARGDSSSTTFWWNMVGFVAKGTGTLTNTEIANLAAGQDLMTDLGKTPQVYTKFGISSDSESTIADSSGNSNTATKSGTVSIRGGLTFTGSPVTVTSTRWCEVFPVKAGLTTGSVIVQGTYVGSPQRIEVGLFDALTGSQVVSYKAANAYPTTGTYRCDFDGVPAGNYVAKARWTNDTVKFARSRMLHCVGYVVLWTGESWAEQPTTGTLIDTGFTYKEDYISSFNQKNGSIQRFTGASGSKTILATFMSLIQGVTGYAVKVIGAGYSGSELVTDFSTSWSDTSSVIYQNMVSAITAAYGDFNAIIWLQGVNDTMDNDESITSAQYKDALVTLAGRMLALGSSRTSSNTPFISAIMGRFSDTVPIPANARAVRAGQISAIDTTSGFYDGGFNGDISIAPNDLLHPNNGSFSYSSAAVNTSTDLVTVTNHGLMSGQAITPSGAGVAAPLVSGTTYYAVNVSANTFGYASTPADALAGTLINLTTTGSGNTSVAVPNGYNLIMRRLAQAFLNAMGVSGYSTGVKGAMPVSAVASGSNIDITFDKGTLQGLISGANLTGFTVSGGAKTINSTSIISSNQVRLTLNTAAAPGDTVDYFPLANADARNLLYTNESVINTTYTVPVRPFSAPITVT